MGAGTIEIGDLQVYRLGFGAMRITGPGVWGPPADHGEAIRVLRRAVELGVQLIDTADAYGPNVSEALIAEALYPYPDGPGDRDEGRQGSPGADGLAGGRAARAPARGVRGVAAAAEARAHRPLPAACAGRERAASRSPSAR